jgi:hypothetical protein
MVARRCWKELRAPRSPSTPACSSVPGVRTSARSLLCFGRDEVALYLLVDE